MTHRYERMDLRRMVGMYSKKKSTEKIIVKVSVCGKVRTGKWGGN